MNRVMLSGQVMEKGAVRYTPAGLPALDLSVKHESQVTEAGHPRKVSLEIRAVGIGAVAEQIAKLAVGDTVSIAGFLGSQRNGRGVLLHITELQPQF
ncbi:MAG TPA: primosomal replication protein N [Burkholderiaceae bacterium]|jgi:primosomal replication protein N|nr:primosomal replication protein N [Burkholderiaceae bacterium]